MPDVNDKTLPNGVRHILRELRHWKANHANMVARCEIPRDRHDLPVDRTVAYRELVRLQEENAELKKRLEELNL